VNGLSGA
jgi:hypothetical protein